MMPIRRNTRGFFDPVIMKSAEEVMTEPKPIYIHNARGMEEYETK
jgi:hypothetical protein